jgi:hypothetical protein
MTPNKRMNPTPRFAIGRALDDRKVERKLIDA